MKLGLVIDLDVCVGCHACTVSCKQWNTSGATGPLTDLKPYDEDPQGVWFNRIRHFEVGDAPNSKTVNMPMSCMHCEQADCVDVCPTGASYKRIEDGIVLIDQDKCMGCNYCSWCLCHGQAREHHTDRPNCNNRNPYSVLCPDERCRLNEWCKRWWGKRQHIWDARSDCMPWRYCRHTHLWSRHLHSPAMCQR